jgi:hypothetical protein
MNSSKTSDCARKVNGLTLGDSRDGSTPVAPVVVVSRDSSDMEHAPTTADGLKGCVAVVTASTVQVLGTSEYEQKFGTLGVLPSDDEFLTVRLVFGPATKSTTPNSSAAKQQSGRQTKRKVYSPLPRPASLMQHGLLPQRTIGQVLRAYTPVFNPIDDHARKVRGYKVDVEEDNWEDFGVCFVDISVEDLTYAMLGFAGARGNPMDVPDKIISAFKPLHDEKDHVGLQKLQRLVVIGRYIYEGDIRKDAMPAFMSRCDNIPSECFLRFTGDDKVLDVNTSLGMLRTLLEPSSELCFELPEEVLPVPALPTLSRRQQATAKLAEKEKKEQQEVLPVATHYRAMPVVKLVNLYPAKPSGDAGNGKKNSENKKAASFKVDATILANEEGDRILDRNADRSIITLSSKDEKKLSPAKLDAFAKSALLAQSRFLKTAEKLPEKMILGCFGSSVLETMHNEEAYAVFLSGCTAANSPRDEIYKVLCLVANKAWSKGLKTSCAMFFRDMVLDASAFEVYLAGVSDTAVRASRCAAMESLRALLPGYKFCSSTVVESKTVTSVAVEASPVDVELEDGFM